MFILLVIIINNHRRLFIFYILNNKKISSLSSITIPSGVTSIDSSAFIYCCSLATVTINKPSGSISGSPWGATTSSPTSTQIVWTG